MASHDDHSSASSFTLRVTGPAAPVASNPTREGGSDRTRPMASRDAALECFLVYTSGYWACGPVASNPNREGGSDRTQLMASHDDHSSASSFTLRVTGPAARWLVIRPVSKAAIVHGRWLRMTITRVLPRLHFGLLGLRPGGFASNPNRKGGSVSTRPMASRDDHSSASSFTLRVTGPAARWQVTRPVREAAIVHS
jgi:hypothetical protein